MVLRLASAARFLVSRPAVLTDQPRLRRDVGLDDWEGRIGPPGTDHLWPLSRV